MQTCLCDAAGVLLGLLRVLLQPLHDSSILTHILLDHASIERCTAQNTVVEAWTEDAHAAPNRISRKVPPAALLVVT